MLFNKNERFFDFSPPHESTGGQDFNSLRAQYENDLKTAGDSYLQNTRLNLKCRQVWTSDSEMYDVSDEHVVDFRLQEDRAETLGVMQKVAASAGALFQDARKFSEFVPEQDLRLFNEAALHSNTRGFESDEILQIFSQASSQESFDAMRMAFDADIFKQARKKIGNADDVLERVLSKASSEESYRLMRMALDKEIFLATEGRQWPIYSDDDLKNKFSKVSSPDSYKAMRMALDVDVFDEASNNVSYILTPSDDQVKQVLSRASSPRAKKIFEDLLWKKVDKRDALAANSKTREINVARLIGGALKRAGNRSADMNGSNSRPTLSNDEQFNEPSDDSWIPPNRNYTAHKWQPKSHQERTKVASKDSRPDYEQVVEKDVTALKKKGLTDKQIQRELRIKYHPDCNLDDPSAEGKFKYIDSALGSARRPAR